MTAPLAVGWKEYVAFPAWGLRRVKAKVDTGARTSALDAVQCEVFPDGRGGLRARLVLALGGRDRRRLKAVEVPVLGLVTVRSSSGVAEERPLIEVDLRLGPVTKRVRLTVANRAAMRFRVLLGRQALAGDFVVDVSRKYLLK